MTVERLIEVLRAMPGEAEVLLRQEGPAQVDFGGEAIRIGFYELATVCNLVIGQKGFVTLASTDKGTVAIAKDESL